MTFNPIEQKRNQKYTRVELDAFFKGSFAEAQRVKRENPSLYKEYRDAYEAMGIFAPSLIGTPAPNVPYKPPTRTYAPSELTSRGQYSEAEIRTYFNSKASSDEFHSDRNEYERKREAGVSYGLFEPRAIPYITTKPPEHEFLHRVSDDLCAESNLPKGTALPWDAITQLCAQKVQRGRDARQLADKKAAADRAAELATLTAKQQAEQAARDRHQADLDRLVELTTPKPSIVPEPIPLATARLVAQEREKAIEVPIGQ